VGLLSHGLKAMLPGLKSGADTKQSCHAKSGAPAKTDNTRGDNAGVSVGGASFDVNVGEAVLEPGAHFIGMIVEGAEAAAVNDFS
jgi:hypothetical protein